MKCIVKSKFSKYHIVCEDNTSYELKAKITCYELKSINTETVKMIKFKSASKATSVIFDEHNIVDVQFNLNSVSLAYKDDNYIWHKKDLTINNQVIMSINNRSFKGICEYEFDVSQKDLLLKLIISHLIVTEQITLMTII